MIEKGSRRKLRKRRISTATATTIYALEGWRKRKVRTTTAIATTLSTAAKVHSHRSALLCTSGETEQNSNRISNSRATCNNYHHYFRGSINTLDDIMCKQRGAFSLHPLPLSLTADTLMEFVMVSH